MLMTDFISQEKIDITDTYHNQAVYPDLPVQLPKPSSSFLGHSRRPHSYLAIADPLAVGLEEERGGRSM